MRPGGESGAGKAELQVSCPIDRALFERGSFSLTPQLRSMLKNYCTKVDVQLILPDGSPILARFHPMNATFDSRQLAKWLQKTGAKPGREVLLETIGNESENMFRVEVVDPAALAAAAAAAAAAAPASPPDPAVPAPRAAAVAGPAAAPAASASAEVDEDEPSDDELSRLEAEDWLSSDDPLQDPFPEPRRKRKSRPDEIPVERPVIPHRRLSFDTDRWEQMTAALTGGNQPAGAGAFALAAQAERAMARKGFDTLVGLKPQPGLALYEHQLKAVKSVLSEFNGRAILADEVGLGKTIEAGMVLTEYLARGMIRSFLILAPASLTKQWQEELRAKFGLEAPTHLEVDGWREHDFLIASLDTAKGMRHRPELIKKGFDLVVVDEAHKLKNQRTRNWRFVRELDPRFLLLLTATPIQNSIEELYNLIYLVQPGLLATRKAFKTEFVHPRNRRIPRNVERLRDLVGRVMVRSRRAEARIRFTDRRVDLVAVQLKGREGELYRRLETFVREHYATLPYFEKGLNRLTLMLLERMVTSSPQALAGTVDRLLAREELPPTFNEGLRQIAEVARSLSVTAKSEAARKVVAEGDEKAIIYTQFRDSQAALARHLAESGHEIFSFHGGLPVRAKDRVIKDFQASKKGVLISTDAGAEGRNLQFCRRLINYDLPWNPMRVEQRIGRVHRLGQERDVDIVNLYYEGSIEEYVVRLLTEKIKLFTLVVGELDSILGLARTRSDIETEIMDVYMSTDDRGELGFRFDRLGRHYERALVDYEGMKDAQDRIFGNED